jgi:hypothetical protein
MQKELGVGLKELSACLVSTSPDLKKNVLIARCGGHTFNYRIEKAEAGRM